MLVVLAMASQQVNGRPIASFLSNYRALRADSLSKRFIVLICHIIEFKKYELRTSALDLMLGQ